MKRDLPAVLDLLRRHGADAVSFQAVEPAMLHWFCDDGEACVAYVDTGTAWVAAGGPLAEPWRVAHVAAAFVQAARERGRRACFFATERREVEGFDRLLIGEQPSWTPDEWTATLRHHRRLREQLRRASAKGVRVRKVTAADLAEATPLRARVDAVGAAWLASRHLAPMSFLVDFRPFGAAEEHRYFVAERQGEVVAFLSAVPVYAGGGWLVEHLPRTSGAPNGTIELLIDAMMRDAAGSRFVTLGLAPLAGPVGPWLRAARFVGRPLYDFQGLHAFKRRLRPSRWDPVWLLFPRSEGATVHMVDSLRAFARGSLVAFGLRSIARSPGGPPWALALPLVPWTALLVAFAVSGRSDVLGFSRGTLFAWAAFDAVLSALLLRSAARPRASRLACSALPAYVDAALSLRHLLLRGLGTTLLRATLRGVATLAPLMGAAVLTWATAQALARPRLRT